MNKLKILQDITAESGVIASLIVNPKMCLSYEMLKPNHFYNDEYKALYWAITDLYAHGIETIDKYNLVVKLSETKATQKMIEKVGGDTFLDVQLDNAGAVARDNEEEYKLVGRKVVECAFRRDTYVQMDKYKSQILNMENDLNEVNSKIITSFDSLAEKFIAGESVTLYKDRLDTVLKEIESDQKRSIDGVIGMKPKWDILSDSIRYEDGDLYLFAARRKHGKSLLLMEEAIDKAKQGLNVIMTSTEMNDKKDTLRILSVISGIPIDDIKAGRIDEHNNGRKRYNDAIYFLKNAGFTREYEPSWTMEKLLIKLKATKHKLGGCDLIVHDYIKDVTSKDSSAKYNELGLWANFLKNEVAGSFEVPVLSAVQLNRNYDIADSDNLERYASAGIKWVPKTREESIEDGLECGNHKMSIFFSRDGGTQDDEEYFDFYLDGRKNQTNLRIIQAKEQHEEIQPAFMND